MFTPDQTSPHDKKGRQANLSRRKKIHIDESKYEILSSGYLISIKKIQNETSTDVCQFSELFLRKYMIKNSLMYYKKIKCLAQKYIERQFLILVATASSYSTLIVLYTAFMYFNSDLLLPAVYFFSHLTLFRC